MSKKIHVIFHTHWDREWYFTVDDSLVLMNKGFKEIIRALKNNENLTYYCLDGQTSILEEFLDLNPEYKSDVKELVTTQKILTGPWFTQPDVFNVHGESIIRNLEYGITQAKEYGHSMMIGYLPDTFGMNAQLPLIYNSVDIDKAIIRRGYDPDFHPKTEFIWQSLDNESEVLTAIQPFGYSMGHPIRGARMRNFDENHLFTETYPLLDKVEELSKSRNIMCTIGGDQVSIDKSFDKFIEKLNEFSNKDNKFVLSNLEQYFQDLEMENLKLETFQGEFRKPKYARVHRTIGSSRYDIKRLNHDAEQHLLQVAEPINVLSSILGFETDLQNIDRAWKYLLESHAHDSIGGCNSDLTNENILNRLSRGKDTAEAIFAQQAKIIAYNVKKEAFDNHFLIFNGSGLKTTNSSMHRLVTNTPNFEIYTSSKEKIDFTIINQKEVKKPRQVVLTPEGEQETETDDYYYINDVQLPNIPVSPLGYSTFFIKENVNNPNNLLQMSEKNSISNENYELSIKNKQLVLTNKITGEEEEGFMWLENEADDGDLYDYSPLKNSTSIRIENFQLTAVKSTKNLEIMTATASCQLPQKINDERSKRIGSQKQNFKFKFILSKDSGLKIKIDLENKIDDQRTRIVFKDFAKSKNILADVPFGYMEREPEKVSFKQDWENHYAEYPVNIYPLQNTVLSKENNNYTAIFTKGCKEYQILDNNLHITLFRGVGSIGKPDLQFRPGRASGREYPTPKAQLKKNLSFEFELSKTVDSLETLNTNKEKFLAVQPSYQVQTEDKSIQQLDYFDIYIPKKESPLELNLIDELPHGIQVSSLKLMKNKKLLLRIKNESDKPVEMDCKTVNKRAETSWGNSLGEVKDIDSTITIPPNSFKNIIMNKKNKDNI